MKIGILGSGRVAQALGGAWEQRGHQVMYSSRHPQGPKSGTPAEAAAFGEVVLNALPWPAAKATLEGLDLAGKILLDATNPMFEDLSGLEVGTSNSGGELVAQWAKRARVVKIFNSTGSANMAHPNYGGSAIPMFYCGDDGEAKSVASQLAGEIGFQPVDVGPLHEARLLEPLAMLWVRLAYAGGLGPNFAFQLVKR